MSRYRSIAVLGIVSATLALVLMPWSGLRSRWHYGPNLDEKSPQVDQQQTPRPATGKPSRLASHKADTRSKNDSARTKRPIPFQEFARAAIGSTDDPFRPSQETVEQRPVKSASASKPQRLVVRANPSTVDYRTERTAIAAALDEPVTVEFVNAPLDAVLAKLSEACRLNLVLDGRAMDEVGIASDTPVDLAVKQLPLRHVLRWMFRYLDLTYFIENGYVLVTTPEEFENHVEVVVYEVSDLVAHGDPPTRVNCDFDSLLELIVYHVAPTTWPEGSGPAPICPLLINGKALFPIEQMQDIHPEIAALLATLRQAKHDAAQGKVQLSYRVDGGPSPKEQQIERALRSPTEMDFASTPLSRVAEVLSQRHNINILLDRKVMDDVGIGVGTPINKNLRGITLRSALRLMLRELDLTYVIADGMLLITSPEECECRMQIKVYPVADLVSFRDEKGKPWDDYWTLIDVIVSGVAPSIWDEVGGPGSVTEFSIGPAKLLVVSQSEEGHHEVANLLEVLRLAMPKQPEGAPLSLKRRPQLLKIRCFHPGTEGNGGF